MSIQCCLSKHFGVHKYIMNFAPKSHYLGALDGSWVLETQLLIKEDMLASAFEIQPFGKKKKIEIFFRFTDLVQSLYSLDSKFRVYVVLIEILVFHQEKVDLCRVKE